MKNRKNYLKARKKAFKWKKLCFQINGNCPVCGNESILQFYKYDAAFCITCNKWLDKACNDPGCPFCSIRPETPYEAYYYEDTEALSAGEQKDWRRYNYQHKTDGKKRHERLKMYNKKNNIDISGNINNRPDGNIDINPSGSKETRALFTDHTVRVYQAFSREIAEEAVKLQTFGPHFKMGRMSWIKPSFLWMMYRCGWASKEGQERVLAIDIKRTAFDYITKNAVASSFNKSGFTDYKKWQQQVKQSDIRCQWDPERDIYGNPLDYRSVQLGLRGDALYQYVNDWIVQIEDITEYVKMLADNIKNGTSISQKLPEERMYHIV